MGFVHHLFSLRRRRKTATTTDSNVGIVKRSGERTPCPEQRKEDQQQQQQQQQQQEEVRHLTSSIVALAPSTLTSDSVNVDNLEFAESRSLAFLLRNALDEQSDCPAPPTCFPQFEYLLHQAQTENQQDDDISLPRRSRSSLRSSRLFHALPGSKNDSLLSTSRLSGLKNARSTSNFDAN